MTLLFNHPSLHVETDSMCMNLVPLLLVGVQSPGQVPGLPVLLFRLSLVLFQRSLVHLTCQVPTVGREGSPLLISPSST